MSDRAKLRHHGDVDALAGLLDFAVNVRGHSPPQWLRDRLHAALDRLGSYPTASADLAARTSAARRHGRSPDDVLILNGAEEGFALLPVLRPRLAALVHPSFTEPDLLLADAGVPIFRVMLRGEDGYRLRPELVPAEADLVVLGNPTNPTSVLHPAETVRRLARPGRVLVVDEAFADAIPGEPESLSGDQTTPGLLVLRSLTKTWALAGLRAGYALGPAELLARLSVGRPHWPVGTLTLEAVRACCEPAAVAEAQGWAELTTEHRRRHALELAAIPGLHVSQPAHAPFLLIEVPDGPRILAGLRAAGIAVRRGDTFPGLTPDHLRIAVRPPEQSAVLIEALNALLSKNVVA